MCMKEGRNDQPAKNLSVPTFEPVLAIAINHDHEYSDLNHDQAPPIHSQLPQSLRELHIDFGNDVRWREFPHNTDEEKESLHQKETFALLYGLAPAKATCFPELFQLHLWHDEITFSNCRYFQPYLFPSNNGSTRRFVETLKESDIDVFFNGINGFKFLEIDENRRVTDRHGNYL